MAQRRTPKWLLAATIFTAAWMTSSTVVAANTSPTWNAWKEPTLQDSFRVVQYLDPTSEERLVVVDAGREQGIIEGFTFKTYRSSAANGATHAAQNPLVWIETGRLKAVQVQDNHTIAIVEEQGSGMSQAFFPKFPHVMAGDVAVKPRLEISRRQVLTPTVTLSYFEIFEDPKAAPMSFEMRRDGLDKIREAALAFAKARVSLLMVEGYTDHHGSSQENQVESYQRAMTVRRYLIDELGFDEKRVVAVGFGELEPADGSNVAGYIESNRRIVLKAVPLQASARN